MDSDDAIDTLHHLSFYDAPWDGAELVEYLAKEFGIKDDISYPEITWRVFRIGTVEGQYRVTPEAYEILSVVNGEPGNGHFEDVLQWFEYACTRSGLPLRILEFTNERFRQHLIIKRGFHVIENGVEKSFGLTYKT